MNAETILALVGSVGGILTTIGLGVKWLIDRVEKQVADAANNEEAARKELSTRLNREIDDLRDTVRDLKVMLKEAAVKEAIYMRRVMMLEQCLLQQPGMVIPSTPGWPVV